MDRIALLTEILTTNPDDAFARYGLALEYSKAGQTEEALHEFKTLIEKNPDYTPAYFMAAQTLASASRIGRSQAQAGRRHRLRPAHRKHSRPIRNDRHARRIGRLSCSRGGGRIRPPRTAKQIWLASRTSPDECVRACVSLAGAKLSCSAEASHAPSGFSPCSSFLSSRIFTSQAPFHFRRHDEAEARR